FPDCFSRLLGFTVCFDATAGVFVAGAGFACATFTGTAFFGGAFTVAAFADAAFADGLTALAGALFAVFFTAGSGRFAFAAGFAGVLCALLALLRATVLLWAGAFAFFAWLAGAGLVFA